MSAGRICVREVDTAKADESIWKAAERMHQHGVGALVVVDESRKPCGILTDRDIVERVVAQNKDPNATTVGEVLTPNPDTIEEDVNIESALAVMQRGNFRRVVVVNASGVLVGVLSLDDVLMRMAREFRSIGKLIVQETPDGIAGKEFVTA